MFYALSRVIIHLAETLLDLNLKTETHGRKPVTIENNEARSQA